MEAFLVPIAGMAMTVMIVFSVGLFKTMRYSIDRKTASGTDPELQAEMADLHARLEALEQEHGRVEELENRLDFAERLLARGADSEAPAEKG